MPELDEGRVALADVEEGHDELARPRGRLGAPQRDDEHAAARAQRLRAANARDRGRRAAGSAPSASAAGASAAPAQRTRQAPPTPSSAAQPSAIAAGGAWSSTVENGAAAVAWATFCR